MLGWHLDMDQFRRMRTGAAKARPRSNKRLTIALAIGGLALLFTCNPFVKKPSVPVVTGPDVGVVGIPLEFKATSTDPNGDSVAFMFDWGDTTTKVWTDFVLSGETLSVSHAYPESSNYTVRTKAKNGAGAESGWSSGHALELAGSGPGYPDSLTAEVAIPVRSNIYSTLVSPDGRFVYLALSNSDRVIVIRTMDLVITDTIVVGGAPYDMLFAPGGSRLYVSVAGTDSVAVVRTSTNTVEKQIPVGRRPMGLAMTSTGDLVFAANSHGRSVTKISTSNDSAVGELHCDSCPMSLAISSSGGGLYVTSWAESTVSLIDIGTDSVTGRLKLGPGLTGIGLRSSGNRVYVGDNSGNLFVLASDLSSIIKTIPLYGCITDVDPIQGGFYMMVSANEHHGLAVLRAEQEVLVGWVTSSGLLGSSAESPDAERLYAADDYRMRLCVFERRGSREPTK